MRSCHVLIILSFIFSLLLLTQGVNAADRYFLNNTSDWNNSANWSSTSGGAGGASVPSSSDVAIFDRNSGNCNINMDVNVAGIYMSRGYQKTITQGSHTIAFGDDGFFVNGGTFVGSSSNKDILGGVNSCFVLSGGAFTSTNGTLRVGMSGHYYEPSFSAEKGIFYHNNGLVFVQGQGETVLNNSKDNPLWNFKIDVGDGSVTLGSCLYVDGNATIIKSFEYNEEFKIYVAGNYDASGAIFPPSHVIFVGSNNQNLSGSNFANVRIDKTGGAANVQSDIGFNGNWEVVRGDVNWNGYKATINIGYESIILMNAEFYDLDVLTDHDITFSGSIPVVENRLYVDIDSHNGVLEMTQFHVGGDLFIGNDEVFSEGITLNGEGTQTITTLNGSLGFINLIVKKELGKVLLGSNIEAQIVSIQKGELDLNGYNIATSDDFIILDRLTLKGSETVDVPYGVFCEFGSTVKFLGDSTPILVNNFSQSFYNLVLAGGKTFEFKTGLSDAIEVYGELSSTGSNANPTILRSLNDDSDQWYLSLLGVSKLGNKVKVKNSHAGDKLVFAIGSVNDGNNTGWLFSGTPDYVWTGAGDKKWSNTSNWKGGQKPSSGDVAYFISNYNQNCEINEDVDIKGLIVVEGYTGTISMPAAKDITIGEAGIQVNGGNLELNTENLALAASEFQLFAGVANVYAEDANIDVVRIIGGEFNLYLLTKNNYTGNSWLNGGMLDTSKIEIVGGTSKIGYGKVAADSFLQVGGELTYITETASGYTFDFVVNQIYLSGGMFKHRGRDELHVSGLLIVEGGTFDASVSGVVIVNTNLCGGTIVVDGSSFHSTSLEIHDGIFNNFSQVNADNIWLYGGVFKNYEDATVETSTLELDNGIYYNSRGSTNFTGLTTNYLTINLGTFYGDGIGSDGLPANVMVKQTYTQDDGIFIAPSTYLLLGDQSANVQVSLGNGIFNHNNGTTKVNAVMFYLHDYNLTFNDVMFDDTGLPSPNILDGYLSAEGNINTGSMESLSHYGEIYLKGSLVSNFTSIGDGNICFEGSGVQYIGSNSGPVYLPDITIQNPLAEVTLVYNTFVKSVFVDEGLLSLDGKNLDVAYDLDVADRLRLKGTEVVDSANTNLEADSTVEFVDSGVVALVNNLSTNYANILFGANKTHKFGAGITTTVSGALMTASTGLSDRSKLYSTNQGTTWNLNLENTADSLLKGGVIVRDSDASTGKAVVVEGGSIDEGNNTNWVFPPKVLSVSSADSDANPYTIGSTLTIRVHFNTSVVVTGTPQLMLNLDGGPRAINYTSGSTTDTLTFEYVIQPGDSAQTLDYISTAALTLPGGATIKVDGGSNEDADLTLPAPGTTGSLSDGLNFVIDTLLPEIVSIESLTPSGSYKEGESILIKMTFNKPITASGSGFNAELSSGASVLIPDFTAQTNVTFTYQVSPGDDTSLSLLDVIDFFIATGTVEDAASNPLDISTLPAINISTTKDIIIDTTAPSIDSSVLGRSSAYVNIAFTEGVYTNSNGTGGLTAGDFDLIFNDNASTVTDITIGSVTQVNGNALQGGETEVRVNLVITGTIANGGNIASILIKPKVNEIYDLAGNAAPVTTDTGVIFIEDYDGPIITHVVGNPQVGAYKEGEEVFIDVYFDEEISIINTNLVSLELNVTGATAIYESYSANKLTLKYVVGAGENVNILNYVSTSSLTIGANNITDTLSNGALSVLPDSAGDDSLSGTSEIRIDTIEPTFVSAIPGGANAYIDVKFSEGVYNDQGEALKVSDFVMTFDQNGGTAMGATLVSAKKTDGTNLFGGETTVRLFINVIGNAAGVEKVNITMTDISDKAGNLLESVNTVTKTATLMLVGPTPVVVKVYGSSADGVYKTGDEVFVAVEFTENIVVSGLPKLTLKIGAVEKDAIYDSNLSTKVLRFKYTVVAGDASEDLNYASTAALNLAGGTIKSDLGADANLLLPDLASPNSLASTSAIVIDTVLPVITKISTSLPNGSYTFEEVVPLTIHLNRPVTLVGNLVATLNTGAELMVSSFANQGTIVIDYAIGVGEGAEKLDITSLALGAGSSLKDAVGNSLNLNVDAAKLSNLHNIKIVSKSYDYSLTLESGGNGSVNPTGLVYVFAGDSKTITITADEGYYVENVTVDGFSIGPRDTYTFENISENHTLFVDFAEETGFFFITTNVNVGGEIVTEAESTSVAAGDSITFSIVTHAGFTLQDVLVDGESVGVVSTYTFNDVNSPHQLQAIFSKVIVYRSLVANAQGNGNIEPAGLSEVVVGSSLTYQISADVGYHVREILVDGVSVATGEVAEYTVEAVEDDHVIVVVFEKTRANYDVVASSSKGGKVSPEGISSVASGGTLAYTFTANEGYHLSQVVVDGKQVGRPESYTFANVKGNHEIIANFQRTRSAYYVSIPKTNGNAKKGKDDSPSDIANGSDLSFKIVADEGKEIIDVVINGYSILNSQNPSLIVTGGEKKHKTNKIDISQMVSIVLKDVREDLNIQVEQAKNKPVYDLVVDIKGNGSTAGSLPSKIARGASYAFSVKADDGYRLTSVSINGKKMGPMQYIFLQKINADTFVEVVFEEIKTHYSILGTVLGHGQISPAGEQTFEAGDDISYTFTPEEGFQLTDILVNGLSIKSKNGMALSDAFVFRQLFARQTIVGVFTKKEEKYQVVAVAGNGGKLSKLGSTDVEEGDAYICEITPSEGYSISDVTLDEESLGTTSVVQLNGVDQHHMLRVSFAKSASTYEITVAANAGGQVSQKGTVTVNAEDNFILDITPDEGYRILSINVNGKLVAVQEKLMIAGIKKDYNIEVTFVSVAGTYVISEKLAGAGQAKTLRNVAVSEGEAFVSSYEAPEDLVVIDVVVDGVSQGEVSSYTFTNVSTDHTITYVVEADLNKRNEIAENAVANADTSSNPTEPSAGKSGGGGGCQYTENASDSMALELVLLLTLIVGFTRYHRKEKRS